jgi:predicted RND superfamily exporter protein
LSRERGLHAFFAGLLRRRAAGFGAVAVVLAIASVFAARVRPNYDAEAFLPTWDPRRHVFEEHAAAFAGFARRVSVFVEGPLDARTHARLGEVAQALRDEGLEDVTWIGNVELASADPDDPFALRVESPFADPARAAEALASRRHDPLLVGRLFDPGAEAFVVHATLPEDRDHPDGQLALEASLERRLASLRAEGAVVRVAGLPVLKARGFRLVQGDAARFLSIGIALVTLLLFVALRRARDVLAILGSLVPPIVITLAVMGATGTPISALTSFVPLLVLIVGVCDSLHLVAEVRAKRATGLPRREAVARAFAELTLSCFHTSFTTAVGFASLATSNVAIVVELAIFTSLAVMLTYASTMLVLPLLLDLGAERPVTSTRWLDVGVDALTAAARRHAKRPSALVLGGIVVLCVAAVGGATRLRTNATMIDDVDPDHPLMRDLTWLEEQGLGVFSVELWIRSEGDALMEPEAQAWMTRTTEWVRRGDPVRTVIGPPDFLTSAARALSLPPPRTREEVAQLSLLLEMAAPSGLDEVWRPAEHEAQIVASVVDLGSARMGPFFEAWEQRLRDDPPPAGVRADLTGVLRLAHVTLIDIVDGFATSLALAGLVVWLLVSTIFRSLWHGFVALLPNVLPLLAMLGAMGALGIDVKPSTLLVFSVAFGVAVDDTLHLIGRVRERLRAGDSIDAAVDTALRTSGRALVLTSLVVGGGFLVLVTSDFQFLVMVGSMTGLAVVFALLGDLVVYPVLLRATMRARGGLGTAALALLAVGLIVSDEAHAQHDDLALEAESIAGTDADEDDADRDRDADRDADTDAVIETGSNAVTETSSDADAIGFAASVPSTLPDENAPSAFRVHALLFQETHVALVRTPRVPLARFGAQVHLEHRGEHARIVLGGHVEADPAARQLPDDSRAAMLWLVRPLDTYLHVDGGEHAASPVTLTLGFQRLGWGEGFLLSPLDLDPKDLRTPGLGAATRATLSRLSTRVSFQRGANRVEITGVHEARFDLKTAPFDAFSPFREPALEALGPLGPVALERDVRWRDAPGPFAAQSQQLFARYVLHASRATFALHAASLLDPIGVLVTDAIDLGADPVRLRLEHRRFALVGGTLAVPLGPVVARVELAADVGRAVHLESETPNELPIAERTMLRGLAGLRWTNARGGVLDVEASYAHARGDLVWPFEVPTIAGRYAHAFLRDRLEAEAVIVATGTSLRGGAAGRAELAWRAHDQLSVVVGAATYVDGPRRSILDGFSREDRAYLRVEGRLDSFR